MKENIELDGEKLKRCPMRLFLDQPADMSELMWYHANYRRGLLPVDGGLLDQPGVMMDQFRVIDGAISSIEAELAEPLNKGRRRSKPAKEERPSEVRKGTRGVRPPAVAKG